jgi:hypothetical protein
MGELEALRLAAAVIGFSQAVACWGGPMDGLHDFLGHGTAIEVKSTLGTGQHMRISSASQLDTTGLERLLIGRPRFCEDPAGITLADLATTIRSEIAMQAPSVLADFNDKLLRAGFIAGEPSGGIMVILTEFYGFDVRDGFPRITPANLAAGLEQVWYSVDERAAREFRVELPVLKQLMGRLAGGL